MVIAATEDKVTGRNLSLKKDFIYAVGVLHDTEHGQDATVVLATKDFFRAVEKACRVERLGYQFINDGTGASVYYLKLDKQYDRSLFELPNNGRAPIGYPIIFRRYKEKGEWKEEWPNEVMRFLDSV